MKFTGDKFRYSVCPKCGHDELEGDDFEYDDEQGWREFRCVRCGFTWQEVYNFAYHCDPEGFRLDEFGERVKVDIKYIGMNRIESSGSPFDLPLDK